MRWTTQTCAADRQIRRNEIWLGDDRIRRGRCGRGFASLSSIFVSFSKANLLNIRTWPLDDEAAHV